MDPLFQTRVDLVQYSVTGVADINLNEAVNDPALLPMLVNKVIDEVTRMQVSYEAFLRRPDCPTKVGFGVYGRDSAMFDRMLMSYGLICAERSVPVPLSFAARLLKMRGLVNQHVDLCPMVVSSITAFGEETANVFLTTPQVESIAEHDLSTQISNSEEIRRSIIRDFDKLDEENLPGCLIIDCFRNSTIGDVVETFGKIASNPLYEDQRVVGYYIIPFDYDFLAHVLRYRATDYALINEDKSGVIVGCGLRYVFEGSDIVFNNGVTVFHMTVDSYINLVYATEFKVDFSPYNICIEVYEMAHGMMVKRINGFEDSDSRLDSIRFNPFRISDVRLINGYKVVDGRVIAQPYQVDGKLYDECYEAVLSLTTLTLDNVRTLVATRSQTIVSSLGRTTQDEALDAAKTEAITISLYLKAFENVYEATQILKTDAAVQGKSLDDFDYRFKRTCLHVSALATIFPLVSLLPAATFVKLSALAVTTLMSSMGVSAIATKLINAMANLMLSVSDWETVIGSILEPKDSFDVFVPQNALKQRNGAILGGKPTFSEQKNNDHGIVRVNDKFFTKVRRQGTCFDAEGNQYELIHIRQDVQTKECILFSTKKTAGMHFKLGKLYSSHEYQALEIDGYAKFNGEYHLLTRLTHGFSMFNVEKEHASHTFYDVESLEVVYCQVVEKMTEGPDRVFLGVQTLKGSDALRTQLLKLQLDDNRIRTAFSISLSDPGINYYKEGLVHTKHSRFPVNHDEMKSLSETQTYSRFFRKSPWYDVHYSTDLYLERLKKLAKLVKETDSYHKLFGEVIADWHSTQTEEPFPGIYVFFDETSKELKFGFEEGIEDVELDPNIVNSFSYLFDED